MKRKTYFYVFPLIPRIKEFNTQGDYWLLHHYFTQCVWQYHCSYTLSLTFIYYELLIVHSYHFIYALYVLVCIYEFYIPLLPHTYLCILCYTTYVIEVL